MSLRSELLLLRRDRAVTIAVPIFTCLCILATVNGVRWRNAQEQSQQKALEIEVAEYADRKEKVVYYQTHPPPSLDPVLLNLHDPTSPYVVGQVGQIVRIPLPVISAGCIGQFDFLPLQELVSIRTRQRTLANKDGLENPLQLLTGRFDLAFNVVYLLPLFILALTYNIVSLEREEGTLGLLRSQPVHLSRLVLLKAGLRVSLLLIPCLFVLLVPGALSEPLQAIAWAVTVLTYGIFWWSLAIWINGFQKGSATNAAILMLCWLLFVAIVPAALQIGVTALRPAPSRLELLAAVRDQSIDQRRDGKELAAAWYAEHPEMLPAGQRSITYDTPIAGTMTHIEQDRRTIPLEERFDVSLAARQDLVSTLRFLSPAVLTYEALQDSAGTGLSRHRHYKSQLKKFRQEWLAYFHPRIFSRLVLRPGDYDAMPQFQYTDEPSGDWIGRIAGGSGVLVAVAAALILLSARSLG